MAISKQIIILIVSFITALVFVTQCRNNKPLRNDTVTITSDTIYIHDTTIHALKMHKMVVIHDTLVMPKQIDTMFVIKQFYTNKVLQDSLLDSLVSINIVDSLINCEIKHRTLHYRLLKPQQVITTTTIINKPKNALYAGGFINSNYGYGITANYARRNSNYSICFDIRQKQVILGYSIKIYPNK
jgi:hypothetical protein